MLPHQILLSYQLHKWGKPRKLAVLFSHHIFLSRSIASGRYMHALIVALVRNLVLAALYFAIFIRCAYSHHSLLFLLEHSTSWVGKQEESVTCEIGGILGFGVRGYWNRRPPRRAPPPSPLPTKKRSTLPGKSWAKGRILGEGAVTHLTQRTHNILLSTIHFVRDFLFRVPYYKDSQVVVESNHNEWRKRQ